VSLLNLLNGVCVIIGCYGDIAAVQDSRPGVEGVAPAYDTNAELTTMAAADILFEVMSIMVKTPLKSV